jgi:hypothetical protein
LEETEGVAIAEVGGVPAPAREDTSIDLAARWSVARPPKPIPTYYFLFSYFPLLYKIRNNPITSSFSGVAFLSFRLRALPLMASGDDLSPLEQRNGISGNVRGTPQRPPRFGKTDMSESCGQGVHTVSRYDSGGVLSADDDQNISSLLSGSAWNGTAITYSFPTSSPA